MGRATAPIFMLNKSKSYGEVFGGAPYRYEQDGKYYNGAGDEVSNTGIVIEPQPKKRGRPPKEIADVAIARPAV